MLQLTIKNKKTQKWRKIATGYETVDNGDDPSSSVIVHFDDGTSRSGRLLVACDGGSSRIRKSLLEQKARRQQPPKNGDKNGNRNGNSEKNCNDGRVLIPVGVMGFRVDCTAVQAQPLRDLDPFFLQGTASATDVFCYFSGGWDYCFYSYPPPPLVQPLLVHALFCPVLPCSLCQPPLSNLGMGRFGLCERTSPGCLSTDSRNTTPPVLDSPGSPPEKTDGYTIQVVVSWPLRNNAKHGLGSSGDDNDNGGTPHAYPTSNEGKLALVRRLMSGWAEPFASLARSVPDGTEVRALELYDWPPPSDFRGEGPVALVGDALHQMCMCKFFFTPRPGWPLLGKTRKRNSSVPSLPCPNTPGISLPTTPAHIPAKVTTKRSDVIFVSNLISLSLLPPDRGEGANHAVLDVADLVDTVVRPHLVGRHSRPADLRAALDRYEAAVVRRARPAVLASRRACLDAHEWARITDESPLLSRRTPQLEFDEAELL